MILRLLHLRNKKDFNNEDAYLKVELYNDHLDWIVWTGEFTEEQLLDWALERLKEEVGRRTENMKEDKVDDILKKVDVIKNMPCANKNKDSKTYFLKKWRQDLYDVGVNTNWTSLNKMGEERLNREIRALKRSKVSEELAMKKTTGWQHT
ncbi:hypothetical protein L1987_02284 [Smallanthus sonchifolius]|uniref:Uncharacterized protein n=1 Tax=Smallanthus sonchifolius TaxID=185202 RepID=A0ACB9K7D8_9ASTR|nr:hypothetical protein L1987_02284 [Smallanthus sonchifolius]